MKRLISIFFVVSAVATNALAQDASPAPNLSATAVQLKDATDLATGRTKSDRHVLNTIFQDQLIAENSLAVHRRAAKMPAEQRYQYLGNWVLPSENHPTFRLAGDFTATHPAPIIPIENAVDAGRIQNANQSGQSRVQVGGDLIAPAFDLIRVAKELGRLDELRTRIEQSPAEDEHQQRSRFAMLMLVDLARGDAKTALTPLEKQLAIMENIKAYPLASRWPEMLALWEGIRNPATRELAGELLTTIWAGRSKTWKYTSTQAWEIQIESLTGLQKHLESTETNIDRFTSAPPLKQWSPVNFTLARSRGDGRPRAHWQWNGNRVDKVAGHVQDYLFYRLPLRGNYEVQCDVTAFNLSRLMVAGSYVASFASHKSYQSGNFQGVSKNHGIVPPLTRWDEWIRYRVVVRDGIATTYLNGRRVHQEPLLEHHEPWLAIGSYYPSRGSVRNVQILGEPKIPEQINISALPDLPGWSPYFGGTVGQRTSAWRQSGDLPNGGGIVGHRKTDLPNSGMERLLRYNRPMLEDGTIEYEFYYRPGEVHSHPALDRLAFMLEPTGVRIHWVTDGKYDRTGLASTNAFDEPENRLGPKQLPLKPNAWNRLQLKLKGDTVDLTLNDQPIYRRKLKPTNQRTFGLFHYADRTEARVRNIVWKGDWPLELPAVEDQELAGEGPEFLDKKLPELTSVFKHDFTRDGLPSEYFKKFGPDAERYLSVQPDGVHAIRPGTGKYAQTAFGQQFRVQGDFDITASFDQLQTQSPGNCTAQLLVLLQDKSTHHLQMTRTNIAQTDTEIIQRIYGRFTEFKPDGSRESGASFVASEANSGRFRIARRGGKAYYLFAQGDSPAFRLIATETVGTDEIKSNGIHFCAITTGAGRASIVWKNLSIQAEKLLYIPGQGKRVKRLIYVMNSNGKQLRQLTKTIGDLGDHGSPAWSPDGKRVAFDTYSGSTTTSHIIVVNADGSGPKDLGIGSMPTFSPDCKRIAFTWSGRGMSVMNSDGSNRVVLSTSGWGVQWSPDGKSIAFGLSGNVTIMDMNTKAQRVILEGDHAKRFDYIYHNLNWSQDSKQVCFKGRNRSNGKYELVVADVAGSSRGFQVLYENKAPIASDLSWHPDGKRILFSMNAPALKGWRLFLLDLKKPGLPQLLPGQPDEYKYSDADWSRDGKQIVFAGQRLPTWEAWSGNLEPKLQGSVPNAQ